jgi:ABC-type nitrate/sulfonate/bicarbonate transport system substrate-binding protein
MNVPAMSGRVRAVVHVLVVCLAATACAPTAGSNPAGPQVTAPLTATLVLDWFPNTNHAGIYLARARGWYEEQGLDLRIEAPSDPSASMKLVGANNAELGVSYQAAVTIARAQDIPVVSVAALVQHNLGAFVAKKESGITRPRDFEGKKFGTAGLVQLRSQLETVMRCDGGDPSKVEEVNIGQQLSQALLADRVDFMALLPTWEGVELEMKGAQLTYMPYQDSCFPDVYTIVFIAGETAIREKPEAIRRFVIATQRGYEAAVREPDEANRALLAAAPDLNPELVRASMQRLAPYFVAEAPRWGLQDSQRWSRYASWAVENRVIPKPIDPSRAFTNEFLAR